MPSPIYLSYCAISGFISNSVPYINAFSTTVLAFFAGIQIYLLRRS